jgi:hypothetical protein
VGVGRGHAVLDRSGAHRLGLLQSAESIGRAIFALGALAVIESLMLLRLDALRCWNAPASPVESA